MEAIAALTSVDWHRLNRVLEQALELEPADRAPWLAEQDLDDELRTVAQSLLARAEEEILDDEAAHWRPGEDRPGDLIGPYRLERELARGGMGVVWLAQRADGSFERRVALKLPRAEWAAPGLAQRMARERTMLASLVHPNIAQLYDAGWTANGRPFLAIEYVEGVPIDAYCSERRLALRDKVRLFSEVARAVAFAQSRLVVHRDLKPANVLITADGAVKLLDFGIAKLLAGDHTGEETALTRVGERALTLRYAAPEQILGRTLSAATDVYALGVLLYELLSGEHPYQRANSGSSAALEEAILHHEPPLPSRIAHDAGPLRGDLDTIVLKALKKAPEARYESAAALADDLDRYLAQQPIRARPDSRRYRTGMFIRRNRAPLAVASGLLATILIGAAVSLWQAHGAREEARRADRIKEFVLSMIRQADPNASAATREADAALLAAAEERVATEMADQPEVAIEVRLAIADAYANRGLMDRARAALNEAVEHGRQQLAPDNLALARARVKLGQNLVLGGSEVLGNLDLGIAAARAARDRRLLAEGLINRGRLGTWVPTGDAGQAERDVQEAYDIAREAFGPGDPLTLDVASTIAWGDGADRKDRLRVIEEAYLAGRANKAINDAHPHLLKVQVLYGYHLAKAGRNEEAFRLIDSAIETARKHHGNGRATEDVLASAQLAYHGARRLHASYEAGREAHRLALARHPSGEAVVGLRARNVVASLIEMRRVDEAGEFLARVHIPRPAESLEDGRLQAGARLGQLGMRAQVLLLNGDTAGAEAMLGEVIAATKGRRKNWSPAIPLGWALRENGKTRQSIEVLQTVDPEQMAWNPQELFNQLAASHLQMGAIDEALHHAAAAIKADAPPYSPIGADAYLIHGRALMAAGRAHEAVASLSTAHDFWREFDPATAWAAEAAYWYGRALTASGDVARGEELVRTALPRLAASRMPSHRATAAAHVR